MEYVENIIQDELNTYGISKDGWQAVYCAVCGDGKRVQGPRGGWLFSDDVIFYHCFNCSIDGNFDHTREQPYSKDMWNIFNAFGVNLKRVKQVIDEYKITNNTKSTKVQSKRVNLTKIEIPDYFIPLNDNVGKIGKKAKKYLKSRNINYSDYQFYVSSGKSSMGVKQGLVAKSLTNRIIIPFYHKGDMIYYQGRSLDSTTKKKYINASITKTNIIYGMDKLYTDIDKYLFVCEGFFDAYHLNGVSVQENKLSSSQIEILEKSPRIKVIVPDFIGDSFRLLEQGLELGWGVSLPNDLYQFKDVSDAIKDIGKLSTIQYITNSVYFDLDAKIRAKILKLGNEKNINYNVQV